MNEFRIEQPSLVQALDKYREMEKVLEEEYDSLQDVIIQSSNEWQGAASEALVSEMEYFLNEGDYNTAYENVKTMRMCMEDTLEQVNALLARSEEFPKQLQSSTYSEPMRPAMGDNTVRNGGVLYLDYGKANIVPDLCDQVCEAAEYLGNVLKQYMEDCEGIMDGIPTYISRVDEAVRKIKRIENYKLSFQKYVQGVMALENDVAVRLAGMKGERKSSLNDDMVTREIPKGVEGKDNCVCGLDSIAQIKICTTIEDFEKILAEYPGGNASLTYVDMCEYLLYLKDNYYICEADYIYLTNSLYSLTHVPSSVVEQIKKQMLDLLSGRKDIADLFRAELENLSNGISVDNPQAILEYYFLTQFTDEVFTGTITIEELREAIGKCAEQETEILERISDLYADNPEDCEQFVSDIADSYKTLVKLVNQDVLEILGWDTEYVKKVLGENFMVDLRVAMFKSGITEEMSIKCFLATISTESERGNKVLESNYGDEDYYDNKLYNEDTRGAGLIQLTYVTQMAYLTHLKNNTDDLERKEELECLLNGYYYENGQWKNDVKIDGMSAAEYIAHYYAMDSVIWYWSDYNICYMNNGYVSLNEYIVEQESCDGEVIFLVSQYYVNRKRYSEEKLEMMCHDSSSVLFISKEVIDDGETYIQWSIDFHGEIKPVPNGWEDRLLCFQKLEGVNL